MGRWVSWFPMADGVRKTTTRFTMKTLRLVLLACVLACVGARAFAQTTVTIVATFPNHRR